MALIDKKLVTERETVSYKLDRTTIELVKFYSEFIGSPQEYVVNESLRFMFRKDKEFKAWLTASNKLELLSAPSEEVASSRDEKTAGRGPSALTGTKP